MKENKIPIQFHLLYALLAAALCYLYYKKIVSGIDLNAPNSINAVGSFATAKPYQFRLLIPLLFTLFKPLYFLGEQLIYMVYNVIVVYLIVIVFHKLLSEYITNKKAAIWLAPVILYTMLWNYVILNQSFQYYDFTAIFLFTLGMYYIVKENFLMLLLVFIIGLVNKETIVYLAFAYVFFNYKKLFTSEVILRAAILGGIFVLYKLFLNYVFAANPGDSYEIGYAVNKEIIRNLFHDRVYMKHLGLNFGALYIFVLLLFVTGRWKMFTDRRKLFANLAFIPYILLGVFITYFTEVRVYTELIPMITLLFIIYLSTFKKLDLQAVT